MTTAKFVRRCEGDYVNALGWRLHRGYNHFVCQVWFITDPTGAHFAEVATLNEAKRMVATEIHKDVES